MKNLDLNSYGVQEMDAKAMEEANGGWEWFGRNDLGGDPDSGWATCNVLGIPIGIFYTFK